MIEVVIAVVLSTICAVGAGLVCYTVGVYDE